MKRLTNLSGLLCLAMLVVAAGFCTDAIGGTRTGNLEVSATCSASCEFLTQGTNLAFGPHDPLSNTETTAQASWSYRCVAGTKYRLYIEGERQMLLGGTDETNRLAFQLYKDDYSTVFPESESTAGELEAASNAEVPFTINGKISAGDGQSLKAGSYSKTLTVTLLY